MYASEDVISLKSTSRKRRSQDGYHLHIVEDNASMPTKYAKQDAYDGRQNEELLRSVRNSVVLRSRSKNFQSVKSEIGSLSLVSLNNHVLLEMFRYLNWIDSIHLAGTCKRFYNLDYLWTDKKRQEFYFDDYLKKGKIRVEKIFPAIAPHISVLRLGAINKLAIEECKNIKSLRINDKINRVDARRVNSWIKETNADSLWLQFCDDLDELFGGITGLKELEIFYFHGNMSYCIEKNPMLKRLSIELKNNFNFDVFRKLQQLLCLHIRSSDMTDLDDLQEFGKLDGLTEFSFACQTFDYESGTLSSFLKFLFENTKLDKLELVDCNINDDVFRALKLFNLTTFSLCCDFSSQDFTKFVLDNTAPRLKHLKLTNCSCEEIKIIIKKWTYVEIMCLFVDDTNYRGIIDEVFVNEVLKIFTNRPLLRVELRVIQHCHIILRYASTSTINSLK